MMMINRSVRFFETQCIARLKLEMLIQLVMMK